MLGAHHPLLKAIRKAVRAGGLTASGCAVAEGVHLLEEAVRSGARIEAVVATERGAKRVPEGLAVHLVDEGRMEEISSLETSQGVVTLVGWQEGDMGKMLRRGALVVALDAVQDPGNAGTIVRAAEAFGATGVVFLKGSVDPANPKALRASAGSMFRMPVAKADFGTFRAAARKAKVGLYAASPHASFDASQAPFELAAAIVIGNEGAGVALEHMAACLPVRIPTQGVESLNAAMSAAILLYEARRQRNASALPAP
jgi:RNA methyltransferase, TrmH family